MTNLNNGGTPEKPEWFQMAEADSSMESSTASLRSSKRLPLLALLATGAILSGGAVFANVTEQQLKSLFQQHKRYSETHQLLAQPPEPIQALHHHKHLPIPMAFNHHVQVVAMMTMISKIMNGVMVEITSVRFLPMEYVHHVTVIAIIMIAMIMKTMMIMMMKKTTTK